MQKLSTYLKRVKERPGMYLGEVSSANLELLIFGFQAGAMTCSYVSHLKKHVSGPIGLRSLPYEEAIDVAIKAAEEAERNYIPRTQHEGMAFVLTAMLGFGLMLGYLLATT